MVVQYRLRFAYRVFSVSGVNCLDVVGLMTRVMVELCDEGLGSFRGGYSIGTIGVWVWYARYSKGRGK